MHLSRPFAIAASAQLLLILTYTPAAGAAQASAKQASAKPISVPSGARVPVPGAPTGVTAFTDVSVIPMDAERVVPAQTVLVQNGWITAMGPANTMQVPSGATRIDGRGKFLLPGLSDCHAHIGGGGTVWGMPIGTDYGLPNDSIVSLRLVRWLSDGVTTVRNVDYMDGGESFLLTGEQTLKLRALAAAGQLRGPRIYTSGQWAPGHYTNFDNTFGGKTNSPAPNFDSVAAYVAAYKAKGYDYLKIHEETPEMVEAVMAAARKVNLPVIGHMKVSVEQALTGMQSIEHMLGYDDESSMSESDLLELANEIKDAGVWNCVTMQAGGNAHRKLVKALQDVGAGLLLGSDYPLGISVHRDLELMVDAGFTPFEALATGTTNFARYLNALDETGTIAIGKRADLVLLDKNPLENIQNITERRGVMIGGRWLGRDVLEDGVLAFPRQWLRLEYGRSRLGAAEIPKDERAPAEGHMKTFLGLTDSLALEVPKSPGYARRIEAMTNELGAMRTALPPERRAAFDPVVRTWLRVQNRQGYRVTIAGLDDDVTP